LVTRSIRRTCAKRALGSAKCSVDFDPAVARRVYRLHLDLELACCEDALHPVLAEDEGVAEGAGAAEAGVAGAEVQAALAAAQAGVDRDRGGREGPVADGEEDGALAGVGGDFGGRVFEHAIFGFFRFFFAIAFFVFDAVFCSVAGNLGLSGFGFFGFVAWIDEGGGRKRQAQRLRRDGDRADCKQGEEQGREKLSHRPTIGALAVPL
jgi:hypothetical protein